MTEIFTWQNSVLLLASVVNLFMSILVASRGLKNKINLYFSLLLIFNFTWSLGLFLSRSVTDMTWTIIYARSTYISAIAILVSLLYFVLHFPYKNNHLSFIQKLVIWLPALFLSSIAYSKLFILEIVRSYSNYEYIAYYNKFGFFIYAIYFMMISFWSISILWKKYRSAEGLMKKQLLLLLFAIIIGLFFGSYFDLFIQYFNDYRYNWLGPIFTVFMNIVVFYFIISPKEKIHA